jgi:hypothetical protein
MIPPNDPTCQRFSRGNGILGLVSGARFWGSHESTILGTAADTDDITARREPEKPGPRNEPQKPAREATSRTVLDTVLQPVLDVPGHTVKDVGAVERVV